MKPPLTYYGGKQKLSKTILSLIPKHTLYCEPFFGGGAVFFAKALSTIEVINDTNGELINFYKIVKTRFKKLKEEINTTLHSRKQYERAMVIHQHPELFDEIQRAWAIWTIASQSYASKLSGSWGYDRTENRSAKQLAYKRNAFTQSFANRLEETQIECTDALEVIKSRDTKHSFFYCDPPYFNAHKGHYKKYSQDDFEKLLHQLIKIKGKFLLSSYPSDLLTKFTKQNHWFTKKIEVYLSLASHPSVKRKTKTEVLTANYPIK